MPGVEGGAKGFASLTLTLTLTPAPALLSPSFSTLILPPSRPPPTRQSLGPGFPVPVEVVPFCYLHIMRQIADLPSLKGRCSPTLRLGSSSNNKPDGDQPAVTDNGRCRVHPG